MPNRDQGPNPPQASRPYTSKAQHPHPQPTPFHKTSHVSGKSCATYLQASLCPEHAKRPIYFYSFRHQAINRLPCDFRHKLRFKTPRNGRAVKALHALICIPLPLLLCPCLHHSVQHRNIFLIVDFVEASATTSSSTLLALSASAIFAPSPTIVNQLITGKRPCKPLIIIISCLMKRSKNLFRVRNADTPATQFSRSSHSQCSEREHMPPTA